MSPVNHFVRSSFNFVLMLSEIFTLQFPCKRIVNTFFFLQFLFFSLEIIYSGAANCVVYLCATPLAAAHFRCGQQRNEISSTDYEYVGIAASVRNRATENG